MAEVFANSEDTDQTPHSAASDLGLDCLSVTLLGVFRIQWVKDYRKTLRKNILWILILIWSYYVLWMQKNLNELPQNTILWEKRKLGS